MGQQLSVLTKVLMAACAILLFWLIWVMRDYGNLKDDYTSLKKDNTQLESDNKQQAKVIATQSFEFNRFNQIATTAYRYGISTDANSENRVIEYRKILQKEPTCDLYIPDDIGNRLYNYTKGLRSSAMHTDTGVVNRADDSAITSSKITYCQAVYWIDPLISTIDGGNARFKAIRDIEVERTKKAATTVAVSNYAREYIK
ncbi:hypothetical protein [Providencia alcalifaciens]|uniref:hypothetical protein n=1 Tax=Providencia alcalifaciens TaxID=126385 RepID=UPI002B051B19|nr:hypothetical protein [Providencia alcalifaciens]